MSLRVNLFDLYLIFPSLEESLIYARAVFWALVLHATFTLISGLYYIQKYSAVPWYSHQVRSVKRCLPSSCIFASLRYQDRPSVLHKNKFITSYCMLDVAEVSSNHRIVVLWDHRIRRIYPYAEVQTTLFLVVKLKGLTFFSNSIQALSRNLTPTFRSKRNKANVLHK